MNWWGQEGGTRMSCQALPPSWDLAPGRKARNSHQWQQRAGSHRWHISSSHPRSSRLTSNSFSATDRRDHGNGKLEAQLSSPAFLTPFDHLHPSDRTFDNLRLFSGEMRFGWAGRGRRDTPRLLLFRLILLLHLAKDSRQSTAKKKVKSQRSKNWSNRDRED